MKTTRRHTFQLLGLTLALGSLAQGAWAQDDDLHAGKVYTSTNAVSQNEVLIYAAAKDGTLSLQGRAPTQGQGTGAGLGSQGAVTLSRDARHLFVVNAASNTLSTFAIGPNGLRLASVVDTGGLHPISVTEYGGIVYVLNAGGNGNVAGFRNSGGQLRPLANSVRGLSAAGGTNPAQVGFGADGDVLVVTEKGTGKLTTYPVDGKGAIGTPIVTASAGAVPFGFAFDQRNNLYVSEAAASALSSYRFAESAPDRPVVTTASVLTTQAAACWVAVTPNGRFVYVVNAGSGTVSAYHSTRSGQITLASAAAGSTGSGSGPIDAAVSSDGHSLYVLAGRSQAVAGFSIASDGSLATTGSGSGLPAGAAGIAAN